MEIERGIVADAINRMMFELGAAERKFPGWPKDPIYGAAILAEEAGETVKAAIDYVYRPVDTSKEELITEAAQTAAMAIRLIYSLLGGQHEDDGH